MENKYTIRPYTDDDFVMLHRWHAGYGALGPHKDMISDTSYILEMNGVPALFVTLLCTNAKGLCYLENYCGNPEFKGQRSEAVQVLIQHLENVAREKGHTRIVAFAAKPRLDEQYQAYGFHKTIKSMSALVREL